MSTVVERISIEVTNRCAKACWFCYNHSHPAGAEDWTADELVSFVEDCAANGVKAVSFGGGEPLQFAGLFRAPGRSRAISRGLPGRRKRRDGGPRS